LTPEQLVQLAREAHGNKKIPGAIAYALSALAKDPNSQSAVRVLEGIRKDAARLAGEARDKAASAGATVVNSGNFKLAQSKDQVASNLTSPAVTQSAVDTYRDAQVAYEAAYSEVHNSTVALATEVRMIGQRFERAMGGDDLTAAQAEFDNLRNRDPNNRLLSEWDKRVKDLVKKIDETRTTALDKKEALTLLEEARRMTDRVEAIKKLEKARALAPDNRDVQAELDRLKTMPKPTPSGVGGGISTPPPAKTPEAAIMDVLHALAAAYNKKSIGEIRNIWPSVPKDYDSGWNSLVRSQQWIFDEGTPPTIVVTGTEATATCRVLMKADTTRGPVESKPVLVIQLRKQPNGWEIVSSRATSTWR
jgi:tetratricopeptide (TPR) repeat protein